MVVIRGRSQGRTTYRLRFSPETPDVFGQTLGASDPLAFAVGPAEPRLWAPGGDFVVLDPAGGARLSVFSVNLPALRVRAHAVGPEHWRDFRRFREQRFRDRALPPLPGRPVLSRTIEVKAAPDQITETALDLGGALPEGLGQLVVVVEPATAQVTGGPAGAARRSPRRDVQPVSAWVQGTRIGLQAMVDNHEVRAWASALADGRPLAGVRGRPWPSSPSRVRTARCSSTPPPGGRTTGPGARSTRAARSGGSPSTTVGCTGRVRRCGSRAGSARWAGRRTATWTRGRARSPRSAGR
jgi:hypothetical protein